MTIAELQAYLEAQILVEENTNRTLELDLAESNGKLDAYRATLLQITG